MKLNIINYNPYLKEDKETIHKLVGLLENISNKITTKEFKPYRNLLDKLGRFCSIMYQNCEKELMQSNQPNQFNHFNQFNQSNQFNEFNQSNNSADPPDYFDEETEEHSDTFSVGSISEYEYDGEEMTDEKKEKDEREIGTFEELAFNKLNEARNRFDFEYDDMD